MILRTTTRPVFIRSAHTCAFRDPKPENRPPVTRFRAGMVRRQGQIQTARQPVWTDHQMQFILKFHYRKIAERPLCISHGREAGVGQEGWSNGGQIERRISWASEFATEAILGGKEIGVMDNSVSVL